MNIEYKIVRTNMCMTNRRFLVKVEWNSRRKSATVENLKHPNCGR